MALWRAHRREAALELTERHWRPEGVRYWQRGGVLTGVAVSGEDAWDRESAEIGVCSFIFRPPELSFR